MDINGYQDINGDAQVRGRSRMAEPHTSLSKAWVQSGERRQHPAASGTKAPRH